MNKPKPIQYGLLFVMRVTLLHILITTATMVMAYAIDSDAQGVLDRKVTVHVDGAEVEHVLSLLSKQAKVKFTYNPQNIPLHKKVTLHVTDAKLSDVLTTLLNTSIDFKIVGKQIALKLTHDASASAAEEHTTAQAEEPVTTALEVSGKVVDVSGMGLPGVNVLVKGTSAGTSTDSDGLYKVTVPTGEETLVFSFIGYTTQEVVIGGRSTIDVTLQEDILSLSEVVVVGYGTQEKKEVTAAISQVKGEDLLKSSAVSASNALAGRVPGLIVNQSNSEPGGDDATVFIRGKSTTGNNSALIVVDGIANRDGISRIDPNDIESITVLKDASAAIYGAQSGNGVILITTKRGKIGKPTISYSFNQGFVSPTRVVKMADAGLFLRSVNADDIANGRTPTYSDQQIAQYESGELPSTDWVKESFKNYSLQNRHSITLSGGSENVKYFVSGGTAFQDGIVKRDNTTAYRQYNIRSNIDAKVSEMLSQGFNLAGPSDNRNFLQVEQNNLFQAALLGLPTMPATIDGLPTSGRLNYNPLAVAEGPGYNKLERNVLNGTLKAKYLIPGIEGLSADGFAAIDVVQDFQKQWTQPYTFYERNTTTGAIDAKKSPSSNQLRQDFLRSQSITLNAKLNYERVFGDHSIAAFVAYEQNEFRQDLFYTQRSDFETDQVDQLFAGSADGQMNDGSARETARQNYFGRVSYSLKDKYMAQVHFRYDGTNIFPADKRFGFFPGVSLGWRISEEAFLADNAVVSNLKLRASWGKLGNDRIDPFQYLSLFGYGSGYVIDGDNVNTLNEGVSPNPNVTWEKKTTFNVGVEAGFLDNKLTFELDVFSDKNRDILWQRNATVPNYTGLQLPRENIGKVDNKGFDGQVLYRNQIGDLSYSVGGNMTFAKNKVVFLDEGATVPSYQRRAGKPVGDVSNLTNDLAYQVIGVYRTQSDLDTYPGFSGKRLGDLIYKDMNKDGLITGDDRVRLDQTNVPQMQYGINLGAQLKGFDFTVLFQGQARAQQYLTYNFSNISNGIEYYLKNAWSATNPNAELPAINRSKEINTLWVRDVSFLRLKNIELGYSIPRALTSKVGIQTLRLYVNGYNLLTFDKLRKDGLADPENINIQSWRYPHTKSINFGLNVTL